MKDYLLCQRCEIRFRILGEEWVVENCYRAINDFKLREGLLGSTPEAVRPDGVTIYKAAAIDGIDAQQLIYFAMSVFWRAATHTWRSGSQTVHIDLGPYLEPLRLFLLDESAFPKYMALVLRVSSVKQWFPRVGYPETVRTDLKGKAHGFSIPGLTYMLLVGKQLDQTREYCTAPSPGCFVGMSPQNDFEEISLAMARYRRAKAKGFMVPVTK